MEKSILAFTKQYKPSSKTLQFRLIPQGKTEEQIKKTGILSQDFERAKYYSSVKVILDEVHKKFIEESLLKVEYDWTELYFAHEEYRVTKDETKLQLLRDKYIKLFVAHFKKEQKNFELKPAEIIKGILAGKINVSDCDEEAIKSFGNFATYFSGYNENRANIYGGKQNSIAYRIVVENFSKFFANCQKFKILPVEIRENLSQISQTIIGNLSVEDIFSVENFNRFIPQSGIDKYNAYLGEVNKICNLEHQQGKLEKKVVFDSLYKQILSDRQTLFFVDETYQSDEQLLQDVKTHLEETALLLSEKSEELEGAFLSKEIDLSRIYVDKKQITTLSQILFGEWFALEEKIGKKQKVYTAQTIQNVLVEKDLMSVTFEHYANILEDFKVAYKNALGVLNQERITSYDEIKECLDTIIRLEKTLKIFVALSDEDKDDAFYSCFETVYEKLRENVSVYNRVRNYATKKEYVEEKYKINFDAPTLGDGWDKNKEKDNNCILLVKDGKYYLGVYNKSNRGFVTEMKEPMDSTDYKKVVYKLLPGPNKMLSKVFFCQKGIEQFGISKEILDGYYQGKHKKGENFDLDFCHKLIDVFKASIKKHADWSKFNFEFSDTETYEDIGQFYKEISRQAYRLTYSYVSQENVDTLVNEGKMFLFQIYNKDFSEKSTGKKNLHTLYWEYIFSDENISNPTIQLCGGAELFYRTAGISNPFVHKKGTILVRKTYADKSPVEEDVYLSAIEDSKEMDLDQISKKYPNLIFRLAPHDIVKNKRFTENQYKIHCPIAFNYDVDGDDNQKRFNQKVAKFIAKDKSVYVIGIDRGERHLLYLSVIDRDGNIVEQRSLNVINGTNYHDKLVLVAGKREEQRKNWKRIENIKEIKQGYLSLVINEICSLIVKYNAIVVMENLNYGFKNSRVHVEQQAYQNFEIALLQKLNYMAFKNVPAREKGGIANAYQLSAKYDSFDKVGTQSGFVFYVPASYTSKIDPTTGFVNLFTSKHVKYENSNKAREFFNKFESIRYEKDLGYVFAFNYEDFGIEEGGDVKWEVCTGTAQRCVYSLDRKSGHGTYNDVDVTAQMTELFEQFKINVGDDLKELICGQESKPFFEKLLWLFRLTVALRYTNKDEDYILSPVINKDNEFFDSRKHRGNYPCDGDGNGAYHIALKGLRLITEQIEENGSITVDKKGTVNKKWFEYARKMADKKL